MGEWLKSKIDIRRLIPVILRKKIRMAFGQTLISSFRFPSSAPEDIRAHIQKSYGHDSELLDLFLSDSDFQVNKWHHYIPIYHRYLAHLRETPLRFLEIGIAQGGGLRLWRDYFGARAVIYGIDISPDCMKFDGLAGQVRIGSQDDAEFLTETVREMGGLDVVLDDGSHRMEHIRSSLRSLFPLLHEGGLYIIEDLHTAYFRKFGGGYGVKRNFFRFIGDLVDDMHHWFHARKPKFPEISDFCTGIHVFNSMVILEKRRAVAPVFSKVGPARSKVGR
jgi:hypothetical protein